MYLSAFFKEDRGRHIVVEVSERQTQDYMHAVFLRWEQAKSMNYTKEETVACRDRLLREGFFFAWSEVDRGSTSR